MDDININKKLQQQWPAYKAALRHDVHIVSTETCAIICAMLLVWGKHEEFTLNPRLICELTYAQQRFMLPGGEVKDELFKRALSYYIVYLEHTKQRDGCVPERIDAMFKERYGFGFNKS